MSVLHRITTQYDELEDRITLIGEVSPEHIVSLALTQRLLVRLLPHLFSWLEGQSKITSSKEIAQSFAQDIAKANLKTENPILPIQNSQKWLVHAVDLTTTTESLTLNFRGVSEQATSLTLQEQQLRQWLEILHSLWSSAEWAAPIWPEWLKQNSTNRQSFNVGKLH